MPSRDFPFSTPVRQRTTRPNSLLWVFDPLEQDGDYLRRKMFGCDAAYVNGRLCLAVADRDEPWDGLLVCTAREHHAALIQEAPGLLPHPILGKWLYIPESDEAFEAVAAHMVELVRARDARIGVEPGSRSRRRRYENPGD
ncbi:MAG: hypothetical protein ACN6OC_09650 [Alcaligenes sp.]